MIVCSLIVIPLSGPTFCRQTFFCFYPSSFYILSFDLLYEGHERLIWIIDVGLLGLVSFISLHLILRILYMISFFSFKTFISGAIFYLKFLKSVLLNAFLNTCHLCLPVPSGGEILLRVFFCTPFRIKTFSPFFSLQIFLQLLN